MTKRDFEMVASVLAGLESEAIELEISAGWDKEQRACAKSAQAMLNLTVAKLSAEFQKNHPRFNAATFDIAARPVFNANRKARLGASVRNYSGREGSDPYEGRTARQYSSRCNCVGFCHCK